MITKKDLLKHGCANATMEKRNDPSMSEDDYIDGYRHALNLLYPVVEAGMELADLMDDVRSGDYVPDSFTNQPMEIALTKLKEAVKDEQ